MSCPGAVPISIRKANKEKAYIVTIDGKEKAFRQCKRKGMCHEHAKQQKNGNLMTIEKLKKDYNFVYNQDTSIVSVKQPIEVRASQKSKEAIKKILEKAGSEHSEESSEVSSDESSEVSSDESSKESSEVSSEVSSDESSEVSSDESSELSSDESSDESSELSSDESLDQFLSILGNQDLSKRISEKLEQKANPSIKIYASNPAIQEPFMYDEKTDLVSQKGKIIGVLLPVLYKKAPIIYDGRFCCIVKPYKYKNYVLQKCCLTKNLFYPNDENIWVLIDIN
jgi:hypothetical protein